MVDLDDTHGSVGSSATWSGFTGLITLNPAEYASRFWSSIGLLAQLAINPAIRMAAMHFAMFLICFINKRGNGFASHARAWGLPATLPHSRDS